MANPNTKQIVSAGQRFGRLTALSFTFRDKGYKAYWKWQCDCGNEATIIAMNVKNGHTRSCGCLFTETIRTHHLSKTRVYRSWCGMRTRCQNPKVPEYKHYGGRGITVCLEWDRSFEKFLEDMGPLPSPKHSIERIDVDGNYEPQNCRWATQGEQSINKRYQHRVTFQGRTLCLSEWVTILGIKRITLYNRLNRGWAVQEAFTTPVRRSGYRKRH